MLFKNSNTRILVVLLLGLMLQSTSALACSCSGTTSFCAARYNFDRVAYVTVDSIRDSTGVFFTVMESLKGNLQPGAILIEDEPGREYLGGADCWFPMAGRFSIGDTMLISVSGGSQYDTIYNIDRYVFQMHVCIYQGGYIKINNGHIHDHATKVYYPQPTIQNPYPDPVSKYYDLDTTYAAYKQMFNSRSCVSRLTSVAAVRKLSPQLVYVGGEFRIETSRTDGVFRCYNMSGQQVASIQDVRFETEGLATGVYIIEYSQEDLVIRQKFFIP